jgi:hypothetical protein
MEDSLAYEIKRDDKPSGSPVSVKKRMDCFEFVMRDGYPNEMRDENIFVVKEFFEVGHKIFDMFMTRGNEARVGKSSSSDPILTRSEFSWAFVFSPHVG